MSRAPRLDEADRGRFSDAVEASFAVSSRQQFFVWTQSSVQALLPHEILICGIEDGSRQGMAVHRFSASRYFRQPHFDAVADPMNGLLPRLMAAAEVQRVVFCPATARATDAQLLALVTDNELKNLAAYLVMGTRGKVEAFYVFSRVSAALDERLAYLIELLVPHVHGAFLRVLSTEREAVGTQGQRSGRLVTPRQEEILKLIKNGKTNSEIAELLSCSPWTIKNHIQAILRKLDSNTRTHAISRAMSLGILRPD
ncbi:MAG TPA: XrtB/PEP-CTERM-associated transcriptional regulator EpsA [Methylibium sp.]|nr:XrtB/PEP-CTERM-associated transcriptional regulator EpsA [Methylibium sp.]